MKQILVLGSEGFIGNHLVDYFLKRNQKIFGCDLFERASSSYQYFKVSRLSPEWEDIFSSHPFDFCVNAAGSGNVPYSMTHPFSDFESNTLDTIRVLDGIRRHNPGCKYLHVSSAAIYGNPVSLPVSETAVKQPLSPYGWHKLMAEQICEEYHRLYSVETAIIRPFSVYGNGLRKQLMWDLCVKLKSADSVTLFGTGDESRDFLQIDDLCQLIGCIVERSGFHFDVLNAGSGKESRISEVAAMFEQWYNGKKKIRFTGESRQGDPMNWHADISKAKQLGFTPAVPLEKGVWEYINWFESLT